MIVGLHVALDKGSHLHKILDTALIINIVSL